MDYLKLACAHLGVKPDKVLTWKVYYAKDSTEALIIPRDEIVLVIDKGIAGCPKYRLPLSIFNEPGTPVSPPLSEPPLPDLTTDELRRLAKERRMKGWASMKRETLIARLSKE